MESAAVPKDLRDNQLGIELRGFELPEAHTVGPWRRKRPSRKAIMGGLFYVYGSEARLAPPIDWLQDPHDSRSWRYELHTLTWLKEPLARHAQGGDLETLAVARDLILDWARAHQNAAEVQSEFAWYDMAAGLRAPYIGYVLRACLAEEMLDSGDAELLRETAQRHGDFLADGENYAAGNNHGLFQDEGLYLLARLLPTLPPAAAWRELALTRLKATLEATVSLEDGAHLEHSPAYQTAIVDLVARLAGNVRELPKLGPLLERMRRTAAWQVTPAGTLVQLGDTDALPAPRWARETARSLRGLNPLFEAGQAFVREGDSYLAVSAAHHGRAHKHSDDTGFVLVERGAVILGDAGRWGYYEEEPDRLYARSAAAHNVLTVDGQDFAWRDTAAYGSGLEIASEDDGWYTIVVANPLLGRQGVEHRRVLLYRPAEALIVADEVRSTDEHGYTQHFHLGPGIEAKLDERGGIAISGQGIEATLTNLSRGTEVALLRGEDDPRRGWTYPGDRERTPVWTATSHADGREVTLAMALTLNGEPIGELPSQVEAYLRRPPHDSPP